MHHAARLLQFPESLDLAGGHKIGRLRDITERCHETGSEALRNRLTSEFDTPVESLSVANRHLRIRSAGVFLDELERRHRRAVAAAGATPPVLVRHGAGIAPEDLLLLRRERQREKDAEPQPLQGRILPIHRGENSRRTLKPARTAIVRPKDTAASPAVVELRGCQAREMNAAVAAPPIADTETARDPSSWRAR